MSAPLAPRNSAVGDLLNLYLRLDDDLIPIEADLTLGRHLDNDVVVAGEDVLDYHLRLELSGRALIAHPLLDATVTVNDRTLDQPFGLAPGDRLELGGTPLILEYIAGPEQPADAGVQEWTLIPISAPEPGLTLRDTPATVGRSERADLVIPDDHISRQHAELWCRDYVWLRDLESANGSSVNGRRFKGTVRLFHGDYVGFDNHRYQLIGQSDELTPVLPAADTLAEPLPQPNAAAPVTRSDTTEIGVVDLDVEVSEPALSSALANAERQGAGALVVGASEPVTGTIFRPPVGRSTIGRGPSSDFVIADQTVSLQHAELMSRAEGCTLTNLMATNGTWVNGESIQSQQLRDGDILRLGRVTLVYKDQTLKPREQRLLNGIQYALLAGSILAALALLMLW
ncbi:MAG: FHA domain-containing protein [Pseudomonadota bacterium]